MITETRVMSRTTTDVPFFLESGHPQTQIYATGLAPFIANNSVTTNSTFSNDNLTVTRVKTYSDLAVFAAVENLVTIENDAAWRNYITPNDSYFVKGYLIPNNYTVTGIDSPFTFKVIYHFNKDATTGSTKVVDSIVSAMQIIDRTKIISSLSTTDTSVTAVFQYRDGTHFSAEYPNDLDFVTEWNTAGVTRSIEITA